MKATRRGKLMVLLVVLVVLALAAWGGTRVYLTSVGVYGESDPGKEVELVIPEGASAREVGRLLESKGIIDSATGLRIKLYLDDRDFNFQPAATRSQPA